MKMNFAARICVHLPFSRNDEEEAVRDAVDYYRYKYGGCTHGMVESPSFFGFWANQRGTKTKEYKARVCLLLIDILFTDAEQKYTVGNTVDSINTTLRTIYARHNSKQKAFWIVVTDAMISSSG